MTAISQRGTDGEFADSNYISDDEGALDDDEDEEYESDDADDDEVDDSDADYEDEGEEEPAPKAGRVAVAPPPPRDGYFGGARAARAARPGTVYFSYPKDVKTRRTGGAPVAEPLGQRKLNYRCTWERNCVKNAFTLAGFKRVRDGTELSAGKKGEADSAGPMEYLGSLLGMGDKAAEDKGRERKVSIPTQLAWCASWTKHPGPDIYATQNRYQRAAAAYAFVPEGFNLPAELKAMEGRAKLEKSGVWIIKPPASSCGRGIRLVSSRDVANGALPKDKKLVAQRYLDAPFVAINGRKFDLRMYCLVTSLDPLVAYVHAEGLVRFSTHQYTMRNLRCRYVHLTNYSVNKKSRRYVEADDEPVGDDLDDDDDDDDDEPPPSARSGGSGAASPGGAGATSSSTRDASTAFKWPLGTLWRWLEENGYEAAACRKRCTELIVKTLIAAESEMTPASYRACGASVRPPGAPVPGKRPCFELFGFDILLDADLKPWIIEVNISPSLMGNSALDRHIKGRLMADVFHTTGFEPYSPAEARQEGRGGADKSRRNDTPDKAGAKGNQDAWRRSGRPDDIALDKLSGEDWDLVCHAEDELGAKTGGFSRAWPPEPCRRVEGVPWSNAVAAKMAARAKEEADAYLPLFECLRFSDCLLARVAAMPVKALYKHCPLGIPAALIPPPPPPRAPDAAGADAAAPRKRPTSASDRLKRAAARVQGAQVRVVAQAGAAGHGRRHGVDAQRARAARAPATPRARAATSGPPRLAGATAKSEAAASYRRDRAPRPSQKSSDADHFRIVDDFSWQQLEDFSWQNLFDGAADDGDPGEEGAKFSQSQKVPAAEQPPRRRNRPDSADRARAPRRSSNRDAGPRQSVANAAAGKPPRW
ncbi:hypothetical protein JL720_14736 [Aureococcus anophagefferens]|nr:hypothetical protein JL720_14736 [Aureococcus anophagefferens]